MPTVDWLFKVIDLHLWKTDDRRLLLNEVWDILWVSPKQLIFTSWLCYQNHGESQSRITCPLTALEKVRHRQCLRKSSARRFCRNYYWLVNTTNLVPSVVGKEDTPHLQIGIYFVYELYNIRIHHRIVTRVKAVLFSFYAAMLSRYEHNKMDLYLDCHSFAFDN